MSLQQMVKAHNRKKNAMKEENDRLKKEALESVGTISNAMVDCVNADVAHVYMNQKQLEGEARKLQAETSRFAKQTAQWLTLVESFNTNLKEVGDIENWAGIIERDMLEVAQRLEELHKISAPNADDISEDGGDGAPAAASDFGYDD